MGDSVGKEPATLVLDTGEMMKMSKNKRFAWQDKITALAALVAKTKHFLMDTFTEWV